MISNTIVPCKIQTDACMGVYCCHQFIQKSGECHKASRSLAKRHDPTNYFLKCFSFYLHNSVFISRDYFIICLVIFVCLVLNYYAIF